MSVPYRFRAPSMSGAREDTNSACGAGRLVTLVLCGAALVAAGCRKKPAPSPSAPAPPEQLSIFYGLSPYPGAVQIGDGDKWHVSYTSTAQREEVNSFYVEQAEKRSPPKENPDEEWIPEKRRRCARRWHHFDMPEGLYIIKSSRALLIVVGDGRIDYTRQRASDVWARVADLDEEAYVAKVLDYARRLGDLSAAPEEREAAVKKIERRLEVNLLRLQELTDLYPLALMKHLTAHPEAADADVTAFLRLIGYAGRLENAVAQLATKGDPRAAELESMSRAFVERLLP